MEDGQQVGLLDAGQEDQKMVMPVVPRVLEVAGEQQPRGVKRSRRDRCSTAKERISKMPPCAAGKRSSIYRGVTRHRWTGRYEAHLWDKSTWNQSQNKKGKQVYLGAYDEEEAAARAYDLAALKYWGPGTVINFPLSDYARDVEEMQNITREEYLASLRRKSSGFSRGVSKFRGVARHHHNGRWEARIGRVFGNKYMYLGTYSTQEEAAAAYDMAAIEYRGPNAVTNFDLSQYIRWLRPGQSNAAFEEAHKKLSSNPGTTAQGGGGDSQPTGQTDEEHLQQQQHAVRPAQPAERYPLPSLCLGPATTQERSPSSPTAALSLLLQSTLFKQMLERASSAAAAPMEYDSISTDPSEVSHSAEKQLDNNCSAWGSQESYQQDQQQIPPLLEDEGSVYHSHDDSNSYHQSVTSNYQAVIGPHYPELDDHRQQQHYAELHHQQQQDPLVTAAYGHGGYSHGSLYTEQDSGASASLNDGSWAFSGVLPLSNIITTC